MVIAGRNPQYDWAIREGICRVWQYGKLFVNCATLPAACLQLRVAGAVPHKFIVDGPSHGTRLPTDGIHFKSALKLLFMISDQKCFSSTNQILGFIQGLSSSCIDI